MRITQLKIKNFRGLSDLNFTTKSRVSVIVGPNATGKTSILEAIRVTKSILMPDYPGEDNHVLTSLGIVSPHTQILNFDAMLGDSKFSLEICLAIELSQTEIETLRKLLPQLAALHVRNIRGLQGQEQMVLVQYFSSKEGKDLLETSQREIQKKIEEIAQNKILYPTLLVNAQNQIIQGKDLFEQEIMSILGRAQSAQKGFISYFPADRAMPAGEVNIQIGGPDIQHQRQSHLGQPTIKYNRLKQYIVNQLILGESTRKELIDDFKLIFDKLLPGKSLGQLTINKAGMVSVQITEMDSGVSYDIDSMSSGEKGLLLTFLLLRRTCTPGGIVLIDEPELHLNPTITKKVLPFLIDEILEKNNLQAFICTHSPEILALAYERTDCTLYHLRNGKDISPILKQDKEEVYEALKKLGAQTSDILFLKGCVFVEGKHDAELLECGFASRVSGYKINILGGRQEIEKEIKNLQKPEKEKELTSLQCFIFDLDGKPSGLSSTAMVKLTQWDRYCFENYLLDADTIYDVLKEIPTKEKAASRNSFQSKIKELAKDQFKSFVAKNVYDEYKFENPGFRPYEIESLTNYEAISSNLATRLHQIKQQISKFNKTNWAEEFTEKCKKKRIIISRRLG
jgi:AAA15 family ATPase/GTPase